MSGNAIEHTGDRFGKLIVLGKSHKNKDRRWLWHCLCVCGNRIIACGRELRKGDIRSCGCSTGEFIGDNQTTHGETYGDKRGLYRSWVDARYRCSNPNANAYHRYGGRGIKVCARWASFEAFMEDMGPTWELGMTLDRINPDGDYEPENCQWLTRGENAAKGRKHA